MILAFATDGSPAQLVGIASLIIPSPGRLVPSCERIVVAAARDAVSLVSRRLRAWAGQDADIEVIACDSSSADRYFVQMGLSGVFQSLGGDQRILAVDYDHVWLHPSGDQLEFPPTGTVLLSAETHMLRTLDPIGARRTAAVAQLPDRHHETSLIMGLGQDLAAIGGEWYRSYADIDGAVERRRQVELAFELAASRLALQTVSASTRLQSSFRLGVADMPILFHFGGDLPSAARVKGLLESGAEALVWRETAVPRALWDRVRSAIEDEIRTQNLDDA